MRATGNVHLPSYEGLVSTSSEPELAGRVALVTGGSGGIGSAICRALSAEGVSVAVGYGSNGDAAHALAGALDASDSRAIAVGADMQDPAGPSSLVAEVEAELGPVDVLIANHGVAETTSYEDLDADLFDRTLAVNLRAPFLLAQRVLPGMRERRWGRVVFISSTAAFRGGVVGPHYASSKAGLHGLTYFLASRTAKDGVTVNAVAPGLIETPMLPLDAGEAARLIPVGRVGRPEEVADLVVAVARNGYITSHVLSADGGMHPG
jgi:3-oxoacyl-[acyl-carrier protein] reductase